jgi:hypothetical protein
MLSNTLTASGQSRLVARLKDVPGWVLCLAAVGFVGVFTGSIGGAGVYGYFGDPDDAARLIQVRELLASWHWFDPTTMKLGGDAGMLSHWSRLVDLPIATLIAMFRLFLSIENAERLVHVVWPLLLFGALVWALFKTTSHVAGEAAGRISILLAALAPLAWYQFAVGRIDHHNVMIAATVSATLLMWAYPERADLWRIGGALLGLALAVGYEALAPAVALGAFVAVWALLDRNVEKSAAAFTLGLAIAFTAAFFATIPPSRWMDIRCDAISLNMVVLIGCGAGGLLVALGPGRHWPMALRLASIIACGGVGVAVFGLLQPRCLAGPMGQLPPLLLEIWLNKVAENESIVAAFFARNFEQSLGLLLFYGLAIAFQVRRVREARAAAELFLLGALVTFAGLACWQYKYVSYASFLSVAPLAVGISQIRPARDISSATLKFGAIFFLNQLTLLWGSGEVNALAGAFKPRDPVAREEALACSKPDAIHDLDGLAPGLIAANIDVGSFIAANTAHRVLSAPYHRIANAIIANHLIFSARDSAAAAAILKQQNVDYVAICDGIDRPSLKDPKWKGTLKTDLIGGRAPGYLVAETLSKAHSIYHVWKVDRGALNLQLSKGAASAP